MRETATSSSPHTVSPLAATRRSPRVWHSHYSPPPLLPFFCPKAYYIFSCVHSPFPLTIHTILPHSSPLPSLFFSLPPFKAHALLSAQAMWSGQREQNNGCLSVSRPSVEGGALAASIFLYCQFKWANAASLLLARLATTVD